MAEGYDTHKHIPHSGDWLEGASSTASPIPSNGNSSTMSHSNGAGNGLATHTPLTTHDSSPMRTSHSPKMNNSINDANAASNKHNAFESNGASGNETVSSNPIAKRVSARPGPGEVKGRKIIVDPCGKTKDKAHKPSKPTYRPFGATEFRPPPDPRLALPGYRDGHLDQTSVPVPKLWKQKLRHAPQILAPYTWSEHTSVGPGPATAIVVVGFNRLTSDTQLRTYFSSFGEVASVESKFDPMTGTPLGICRIQFRDSRSEGVSAADAARRAEERGSGQRMNNMGDSPLRVERDRVGRKCARIVARAAQAIRDREAQEEKARESSKKQHTESENSPAPPPNAPKGPAGRSHAPRPPPPVAPPIGAPAPVSAARAADSLIEENVLGDIKRKPYIFIPHSSVPVMGTTIPHLKKRLKSYDVQDVRLDRSGYFVVFQDSQQGEEESVRCFRACNGNPLFTYTMFMELQKKGNPNYVRSPSPERAQAFKREQEVRQQLEQEEREDQEEEVRRRARCVDPVHAAMEQLRVELFAKIIADVKQRIAVPSLHDLMAPENHVERRKKLNIADPVEQKTTAAPAVLLAGASPLTRTTNNRSIAAGGFFKKTRGPTSVSLVKDHRKPVNVFADDRRRKHSKAKKPAAQAKSISLHQQLAGFDSDQESDDDARSSREDTKDPDSRSISRMSSVAPTEDIDDSTPRRRKRLIKEESGLAEDESEPEDYEGVSADLDRSLLKKDSPSMTVQELVAIVKGTPAESMWYQNAKREIEYRAKQKATDRLFDADAADDSDADARILAELEAAHVQPTVEVDAPIKKEKKSKAPKRKTKKQLNEERQAAEREAAAAAAAHKDVDAATGDVAIADVEDAAAEADTVEHAEANFAMSTTVPQRTVEDDPSLVKDIDGWQELVKDQEDFEAIKKVYGNVKPARIKDVHRWAAQQKEIKAINNDGLRGPIYGELVIQGYFVPTATGAARSDGSKKILESEKSKYLEHRLRVAAAREARQAAAKTGHGANAGNDSLKGAKIQLPASSSRSNRASKRTHARDINALNTAKTSAEGQAGDAIRFNNLQKRKKLVKFDRSAIHGWGLYAEERIQMNDMIIEYVGEKVRQAVANIREIRYDKQGVGSSYLFRIDEGWIVDATKKGGIARFINHSCSPNCTAKIIKVDGTKRIVIYALRDIAQDEELTYDYKFDREIDSEDRIPCLCGTDLCKGFLN